MAEVTVFSRRDDETPTDPPEVEAAPTTPQVLPRTISTPPGPPWEQARAARLEARHGAPLAIADVAWRLRRLEPWAPGRPGRYAAFYVRVRELKTRFTAIVEIDGRPMEIEFRPEAEQRQRVQAATYVALAILGTSLLSAGAIAFALHARSEAEMRLAASEQVAAGKLRAARVLQRRQDATRRLHAAQGAAAPVASVMADLGWASVSRAADSQVVAVHWDHGLLAVEARGDTSPFPQADGSVVRPGGLIRPGVYLWGVKPPKAASRPTSAAGIAP
jgi:hypothetical protein